LELATGFRVPIQPIEGSGDPKEVLQTIRAEGEDTLLNGKPNG
jgi:hypothetical protein